VKGWRWLMDFPYTWGFFGRVVLKASALFLLLNLVFIVAQPLPTLSHLSVYNWLVPGRERLPYGESADAFNLTLDSVPAMLASHQLSRAKAPDEVRVLLLGDSSVWGMLLPPHDTLSGWLNRANLRAAGQPEGRRLVFYNLGYPTLSALKDLLILDGAMGHTPDLIVWVITPDSLYREHQLGVPLVQRNTETVRDLIRRYDLDESPDDPRLQSDDLFGRSLIGQRRALADLWRLQLFGIGWALTGIDQVYADYTPVSNDLPDDETWQGQPRGADLAPLLALDVLHAGQGRAGQVPILWINAPIYRADGSNSDLRYNVWYPRWTMAAARDIMAQVMREQSWHYLDAWDAIPPSAFTDSPLHLTQDGSRQFAALLHDPVLRLVRE